MASNIYYINTTIKLNISIKRDDGTLTDPTGLTFVIEEPDGVTTSIDYITPEPNGNSIIHKSATGQYYLEWPAIKIGEHIFKYQATGNMSCAIKGTFLTKDINP